MPLISVQELCRRADEVLRQVWEEKAEYVIIYRGRPTALLLPMDAKAAEAAMVEASKQTVTGGWEAYARAAERVRQAWPVKGKAEEVLSEVRR
jgi:PHD/YefM family antitoxin component YafN of YafNO toxin-antitoxin module